MPKKSSKTAAVAATTADEPVAAVLKAEESPVVVTKKVKKSTKSAKTVTASPSIEETPLPSVPETTPLPSSLETDVITECAETGACPLPGTEETTKKIVTKASIILDLESVFADILTEIKDKTLVKRTKQLKKDLVKLFKLRSGSKNGADNPNSGFRKPVDVSAEMRTFLNLPPDQLTRRVDVTSYVCDYIRKNNLQDTNDRRNIIPDATLRSLFRLSESDPPLTYYSIQQKLQPHIIKV